MKQRVDAHRWKVRVREAEAELVPRITLAKAGLWKARESVECTSTLLRLRHRLVRILDRYGSMLN